MRYTIVLVLLLLLSTSFSMVFPEKAPVGKVRGALTLVQPIVIEGNSGFASHPRVTGGGTISNPYLITNYLIDCSSSTRAAIAIRNTTAFFLVKNVTIYASSSSPAILTRGLFFNSNYQAMNGRFENVTVIGGGTQVYLERPIRLVFVQCNFTNPSGTGNALRLYGGYDNTFDQNIFNFPNQDILIEYYSYYFFFKRNTGTFRDLTHDYFRYCDISNNTLTTRSWKLYTGYSSDFQGNTVTSTSSTYDLLSFYDSHRIKIANNTLQGGKYGIFIAHPNTYGPVATNYYQGGSFNIEFNRINGSNMGLYFAWLNGYSLMNFLAMHHNRISNCTSYGYYNYYTGYTTNRIFRNLFEFNRGTGTSYSTGISQAFDGYGPNSWSYQGVGNFWLDKTGPDDDSDGFVDDHSYPLNGWGTTGKDPAPVTNRFFDFERPMISLIEPSDKVIDAGYVNVSWSSHDNLSGMETVQLKLDDGLWTNRSYEGSFGFKLTTGSHRLYLRAVDRARLWTTKEVSLFVTSVRSPVTVSSPIDGGYNNRTDIPVIWSLSEGFVPVSFTSRFDSGILVHRDPSQPFGLTVSEGFHNLVLSFQDAYGNVFVENIGFAVDMTPPVLDLLYPSNGVVIANPVVYFKWHTSDLTGVNRTLVRLDDGEWNTTDKDLYSIRVGEGYHRFKVRVTDRAGNAREKEMSFWVKANTSLHISSPLLEGPTSDTTHKVEWEYLSDFVIGSLTVAVDNDLPAVLSPGATDHDIALTKDGIHYVTVRALDPVKNEISDRISIILDRTAPDVGFLSHEDGSFVNTDVVDLEWNALETYGLGGYSLYLDGDLLASGIKERTRTVRLGKGVHDIGLEAYDLAGNIGRANITITVDLEPPVVELVLPEGNLIKDRYHTMRWTVEDDHGVAGSSCSLDGEDLVDLGEALSRDLVFDEEGPHSFTLICVDVAGNNRTIVTDLMVDLNGPKADFLGAPSGHIKEWKGIVHWSASDSVGIKTIILSIDGTDIPLSANATFLTLELADGPHTFNLSVIDNAGRTIDRSISFTLDRSPPKVVKALENAIVKEDRAKITWVLEEPQEGLTAVVLVDNETHPKLPDLTAGEMEVGPLGPGLHTIELVLTDIAGNRAVLSWQVSVSDKERDDDGAEGSVWPIILGIVILLVILVSVVIVVVFKRRRSPAEVQRPISAPKRPERIKVGGAAMRPAPTQAPVAGPKGKGHVLDEGFGPSYYRPEKASKKKGDKKRSGTEGPPHSEETAGYEGPPPVIMPDTGIGTVDEAVPPPETKGPELPVDGIPPASEVDEIEAWGGEGVESLEELEELEEVEEWGD
jgi:hypothetical protein